MTQGNPLPLHPQTHLFVQKLSGIRGFDRYMFMSDTSFYTCTCCVTHVTPAHHSPVTAQGLAQQSLEAPHSTRCPMKRFQSIRRCTYMLQPPRRSAAQPAHSAVVAAAAVPAAPHGAPGAAASDASDTRSGDPGAAGAAAEASWLRGARRRLLLLGGFLSSSSSSSGGLCCCCEARTQPQHDICQTQLQQGGVVHLCTHTRRAPVTLRE
jgi:hypothetical protein